MRQVPVPMPLLVLAARQAGLASTAQCDDEGVVRHHRRRLVAAGRARVATRGVLDLRPALSEAGMADDGPDHRRRRAAMLALLAHGPTAVSVGPCALALLGVQGLPATIRPEVALPHGTARARWDGIVVRRFDGAMPTYRVGGFRVASPAWALTQAVCELGRDHAVAVLDSAIHRGLLPPDRLGEVARLARGRRGAARLAGWWSLVDGRSESPLETRARLRCADAGVPPDELQVPVRDEAGRIVARGDLGWRLRGGRWLVAEVDGAGPHGTPDALFRDRWRQNAVVATGRVDLLRFTAADVAHETSVPAAIRDHLTRDARARPSRGPRTRASAP